MPAVGGGDWVGVLDQPAEGVGEGGEADELYERVVQLALRAQVTCSLS